VGVVRQSTQIGNVLHGFQTGMGPDVVVFKGKGSVLLWPDSGNSNLQLSQHCDLAVRVYDLSGFKEIQKDHPFQIPKDSARHLTR